MTPKTLRIGTRGSPMALAQAHLVRDRLRQAHADLAAPAALEIVVIKTIADTILDRPLAGIGGKGLFTKEIEEALIDRRIDLAVHSMKDVPTWLPPGLAITCILPRDDVRDAFLSPRAASLDALPSGATIGTSSLRRQAQILHRRPDLRVASLRGNANTRLRKLEEGQCDATLLALCGLERLGLAGLAQGVLTTAEMLPAVAQGAIGVECRAEDAALAERLQALHCTASAARVASERALLAELDGSCRTPIAALAEIAGDRLVLEGLVAMPDGSAAHRARRSAALADGEALGRELGRELRRAAGPSFFAALG